MSQPLSPSLSESVKMETGMSQLSSQPSLPVSSQTDGTRKRRVDPEDVVSPKRPYKDEDNDNDNIQRIVSRVMYEIHKSPSSQDPPPQIKTIQVDTIVQQTCDIISGIAFNRDSSIFVTGGIDKQVRIYLWNRFHSPMNETKPVWEAHNHSKVSCVLFSTNSDVFYTSSYDGYIRCYDYAAKSTCFDNLYRCMGKVWSIDTHIEQPDLLASASDGGIVSIADLRHIQRTRMFVSSIEYEGSATCVKFRNANQLCVGAVDNHVRLYDIRKLRKPVLQWKVLKHSKPISYISTSGHNIISSGIDSTVKCWTEQGECVREYTEHMNNRNFTGLACTDQLLAIGSEDNQVFIYDKDYKCPAGVCSLYSPSPAVFVTSVAFHRENEYLLAGNSSGRIAVIKLESAREENLLI